MCAIICDARKGNENFDYLALVDRSKSKKSWWTSDESLIIKNFSSINEANSALCKINFNNPKIVKYEDAERIIKNQSNRYDNYLEECEDGLSYLSECGDKF